MGPGDPPEWWQDPSSVLLCLLPRRQDDVIGRVSLSHQQISAEPRGEWGARRGGAQRDPSWHPGVPTLSPSAGIDRWLSLAPVNPDQEVQGEIHLELQVPERGHPRVLRCHLIEARLGAGSSGAATTTGSYFWWEGGEKRMGTMVAWGLSSPFHTRKDPHYTRLGTSVVPAHV